MNLLVPFMLALAAGQGEAFWLALETDGHVASARVTWNDLEVPMAKSDAGWVALLGIDLEIPPGDYPAVLRLVHADGLIETRREVVNVEPRTFPTTRLTVEPKYVELSPTDRARADGEAAEIANIYARLTPEPLWDGPFQVPIPGVTGGRNFGHRRVFNEQPRAPHSGADLRAASGTPVRAANRGRVVLAKNLFFSGNAVFLDHGLGVYSVYLHLSEIAVEPGTTVDKGEIVGLSGATGRVTGPHLHWGARVLGARVDPFSLLGPTTPREAP